MDGVLQAKQRKKATSGVLTACRQSFCPNIGQHSQVISLPLPLLPFTCADILRGHFGFGFVILFSSLSSAPCGAEELAATTIICLFGK